MAKIDPNQPTALYRAFATDGTLLYVGISNNPYQRFRTHQMEKDWWDAQVAALTLEWHPNRQAAAKAEYEAIHTEGPSRNQLIPYVSVYAEPVTPSEPAVPPTRTGGCTEIAGMLGVKPQRVQKLAKRVGFPAPVATSRAGRTWDLDAVAKWAETWDRGNQGGRPRKQPPAAD